MRDDAMPAALARLRANHDSIVHAMQAANAGNPFAAEPDDQRRRERLQTKSGLTANEAAIVDKGIVDAAARQHIDPVAPPHVDIADAMMSMAGEPDQREKVWGDSVDFVDVSFLEIGACAARAVGRVALPNGRPVGTGFLVGGGLFLTNHHVIESPEAARRVVVEFDYERDRHGNVRPATRFAIDPSLFLADHHGSNGLDYALMAIGARLSGAAALDDFGFVPLSDASDKHMLGEFVNIVQHPDGRFKEVVLRENRLVGRFEDALHYVADTQAGSSGSPVFNSEWQVVALHHWGGPWRQAFGPDAAPLDIKVNEGIRISAIIRHIREIGAALPAEARARIDAALALAVADQVIARPRQEAVVAAPTVATTFPPPRIDPDGRVTFTLPIEISVRIPGAAGGAPVPKVPVEPDRPLPDPRTDPDAARAAALANRRGHDPAFLSGFAVAAPILSPSQLAAAARNRFAAADDPAPHELRYQHFSVAMHADRRLLFWSVCDIDGSQAKRITSKGDVVDLPANDKGLESLVDEELAREGAESRTWRDDPRIRSGQQAGDSIYSGQKVPGFPDNNQGRMQRMLQKGHMVRRLDPMWGQDAMVRQAESDTYFYTNAAPQVGFFNMGQGGAGSAGGGRLWLGLENYVLRNAIAERARVISMTGPVLDPNDRPFRDIQVPGRFWKLVVWTEAGQLRSLAMIADQRPVISVWPEALWQEAETLAEAEAYMDPGELDKVADFLSTVAAIEALTCLDFGAAVKDADIRKGEEEIAASSLEILDARTD